MEIDIRDIPQTEYVEVKIKLDSSEHDLGWLSGDHIISLASKLSAASVELLELLDNK